jgi:hypothetical protein
MPQTHAETTCTRCAGTRHVPVPYVELAHRDRARPPMDLLAAGYTCVRCRAVLAGRPAVDPLVTPESRERTAAARRSRPPANLTGQEPWGGAR